MRYNRVDKPLVSKIREQWSPPPFDLEGKWPIGTDRFDTALMKKLKTLSGNERTSSLTSNRSNDSNRSSSILRIKRSKIMYSPASTQT